MECGDRGVAVRLFLIVGLERAREVARFAVELLLSARGAPILANFIVGLAKADMAQNVSFALGEIGQQLGLCHAGCHGEVLHHTAGNCWR